MAKKPKPVPQVTPQAKHVAGSHIPQTAIDNAMRAMMKAQQKRSPMLARASWVAEIAHEDMAANLTALMAEGWRPPFKISLTVGLLSHAEVRETPEGLHIKTELPPPHPIRGDAEAEAVASLLAAWAPLLAAYWEASGKAVPAPGLADVEVSSEGAA